VIGLFITLVIGLAVGALAKWLMPGKDPGGLLVTSLLGIGGAFVAGFLGSVLGLYSPGEAPGLIASVLGAMSILFGYRVVRRRRQLRA
jgi:uncharacterized membrane protein YeaQ/YmgE (transglycosylase-associated protein family)